MSTLAEPRVASASAQPAGPGIVDEEHPWLGLEPFTEETRQYFHGREEEIAELARRVQRKTLAVLFGQSGLGKTSILRAGIVPRLRREGYCPVYVRIDYSPESPPPAEQIKRAIFRATEALGRWTRPGSAVAGESLWEFLHHRDDVLEDASGRTLTPLLIFDQFEEIFTIGQNDDFGRRRAAEFVEDLADLVENRPPKALEAALEREEAAVERFDFNRADYRVLVALREDYLAHLEGFRPAMPSITQNRMRLARMTGQQALAAVLRPGGRLVSEEVAESIVRFVAGGSELRNAEVEPSLLSLVCRELNNTRIASARAEISADLLAGTRDTILHEFYERALADQPAGVRRFIEDEMLTESGFRESLGEERVLRAFAAAGAPATALATLVNRRLLRIEERLDLRRVELTHDVLCEVVQESRELRHEREAKEEAERELRAQREREAATRKALVRARQVAAACAVLAIGAIGGAVFGYVNMKRAQEAEAKAESTRAMAERSRIEAEKLVVYLLDDFHLELEPVGRLDVVANLSRRAVDYYAALPPQLRNAETRRNQALAQVRYGTALRYLSQLEGAGKVLGEAVQALERMRRDGDRSESTAIGLGLGLVGLARVQDSRYLFASGGRSAAEAEEILRPLVDAPAPSVRLRRAYGEVATYLGFSQLRGAAEQEAVAMLERSREAYRGIDGLKLEDISAAVSFVEVTGWKMEALTAVGGTGEARRIGQEALPLVMTILERRPGDMRALRARALVLSNLSDLEARDYRRGRALELATRASRDWESFVRLDPGNTIAWNNLNATRVKAGEALEELGRLDEARRMYRSALGIEREVKSVAPMLAFNLSGPAGILAVLEANLGLRRPWEERLPDHRRLGRLGIAQIPGESLRARLATGFAARFDMVSALVAGEGGASRSIAQRVIGEAEPLEPADPTDIRLRDLVLAVSHRVLGSAAYDQGDYKLAEKSLRTALAHREKMQRAPLERRLEPRELRILIGLALARQGRHEEARALVEPELAAHREIYRKGSDERGQHLLLVQGLIAAALATPSLARSHLAEAEGILERLAPQAQRLRTVVRLREEIAREIRSRS